MKKLNINLIAIDLDHTLISFGLDKISILNTQAINFAKEKGKEVVITTGRSFSRSIAYSKELGLNYHICFGGALLYSLKEEKVLHFVKINQKHLQEIFNSAFFVNPEIFTTFYCYDETTKKIKSFYLGKTNKAFIQHNIELTSFKSINHTKEIINHAVIRINVFGNLIALDDFSRNLKQSSKLNIIKNYDTVLEITETNVTKGSALKILIRKLGIDKRNIMAFGDSYNDISLFNVAKYGIAVDNSVQDLKDKAFQVTDSYDESGVGKAMFKLLDLN